jgi:hypothetical protein
VLNKQQRTSDKGCSTFWCLGDLLKTLNQVTALLNIAQSSGLGGVKGWGMDNIKAIKEHDA